MNISGWDDGLGTQANEQNVNLRPHKKKNIHMGLNQNDNEVRKIVKL